MTEFALTTSLPTIEIAAGELSAGLGVLSAFVKAGLVPSTGEARRQVKSGGLRVNDALVSDERAQLTNADLTGEGSATAARMARVLATTREALSELAGRSSASAMARADAVRFSICDEAADSERSRTGPKGASSCPNSASNRAISLVASSNSAACSPLRGTGRDAISGVMAAR